MKIRPLHDRILIRRLGEEGKTKGGIVIPDAPKEKPMQGKVLAVGKGKINEDGELIALKVTEGDTVPFDRYAGTEIKIESEDQLIIREDDILGIVVK